MKAITCAKCNEVVDLSKALILWNQDDYADAVVVHRGQCDMKEFKNSGGAAFGPGWHKNQEARHRFLTMRPESVTGLKSLYEAISEGVMKDEVLENIKQHGPINQRDIGKMMGMDTYRVLETIYPLMKGGIVKKAKMEGFAKWVMA